MTAGYVGVTDSLYCRFIPELLELYPDAKVVLAHRDRDKWWESYKVCTRQIR